MPAPNYRDPYYHERAGSSSDPCRLPDGKTEEQESSDSTRMMGIILYIAGALFIITTVAIIFA